MCKALNSLIFNRPTAFITEHLVTRRMEIKRGPRYSNKKCLKKINYIWSKRKTIKIKLKKNHIHYKANIPGFI